MDFFDLQSTTSSNEKVQRFGRRVVEHYQSLEPEPLYSTSIPDIVLRKRNDLFLRPLHEYDEPPDQQDIGGLQSHFEPYFECPELPILKYKQEIVDTIKQNMVTVITAPTGSGKSTQVPQYIMDDEYCNEKRHSNIVVTQPRRVAAMSLANRVLSERNLPPLENELSQGTLVGYQIGMDRKVNDDTRLTYMTTGVLLRKLICAQTLKEFTHIILDEVHERDKDTDFLLLLIKRMLCKYGKHQVKVVIMSATVNARKFADYFQTMDPHVGIPCPAPIIEIQEQMFNVVVFYLEQIRKSISYDKEYSADGYQEPMVNEKMYLIARDLIKHFDEIDYDYDEAGKYNDRGSVLVFLPGIYEIESMQRVLKNDKCSETYDIICLHSTIPRQYQMRVFQKPTLGRRKVILSTNIAESSITVPDIKYVVDFCLSKELYADSGTGMSSLKYVWAPKSSLDQRKGRAGRVSKGRCYRLINKDFINDLNDFTTPEMQRCSVEQLILWCKILNIGDPREMLSYALDPPDLNKLREGGLLLLEVGALVLPKGYIDNPLDQDLTFLGHVMGSMPLDVRLTRLIVFGFVFDCLSEAVIMAACLSLPAFLEVPYNNKDQKLLSYVSRMKRAKGTFSDPIMMLNVYNEWYDLYAADKLNRARDYCKENFLNYNRVNEVASLVQDIFGCLRRMNIPDSVSRARQDSYSGSNKHFDLLFRMKLALAAANYPYYYIKNKHALDKDYCMRTFGAKSPADTVMYTGMRLETSSNAELERKYHHDISRFFKDVYDPIKRLTLESNRLYVTFDMISEAEVSKSVYYALKTKQLGLPLKLQSKRDTNLPVPSLQTYDLPEDVPIFVSVTHVESPTKFFVQIRIDEIRSNFDDIQEQMQSIPRCRYNARDIVENTYGMTTYDNHRDHRDPTVYRVKAVKIDNDFNVKVHYLDFGNYLWINANIFFRLPYRFLTCPFQAVECSLEGVCPALTARSLTSTAKWDPAFIRKLTDVIVNKHFEAEILYLLNNVLYMDLRSEGANSLKQWLISCYHTDVSVAVDDYRTEYARMMIGGNKMQLETVIINDEHGGDSEPHIRTERCTLSGPTSPYEVEYCGLTDTAKSYRTVVDSNSVCSITICTNPSDEFTELLTASTVALSSSGCRVQLRGTTQHYPIKGLPDMMVMLFSPKLQLHSSPSRLNYVGCVAGLGVDRFGEPLWPDHDLQVTFDCRILSSDIKLINQIRLAASSILQSDDDDPSKFKLTVDAIKTYQRRIQGFIKTLLKDIDGRQKSIENHENIIYSWHPENETRNNSDVFPDEYGGEDNDILRPHSILLMDYDEDFMHIESKRMKYRVRTLQQHVYQLNETTGVNSGQHLKCELCNIQFQKFRELRSHIESIAHLTEVQRLDYWTCPKS